MPCNDITELLKIRLDTNDRILSYSLTKNTCGGVAGTDSLIEPRLKGIPARDLLCETPTGFFSRFHFTSDLKEFVYLKHFHAVQSGLSALLGERDCGPDSFCVIDSVEQDSEGTSITAFLHPDILTEHIQACGNCPDCGEDPR